jgi:hypothetical protein
VDVDLGRHDGNEHGIGTARELRQRVGLYGSRRVDDEGAAIGRS